MKPEQQNIAIAQVCGWKVENYGPTGYEKRYWRLLNPDGSIRLTECTGEVLSKAMFGRLVPNYCNDLNAMHEAEKTLQHYGYFADELAFVMGVIRNSSSIVRATAAQRAEAFLRTLNLWQES